jgi:hypothetical protein
VGAADVGGPQRRALILAELDVPHHPRALRLADQRPHRGAVVAGVAERDLAGSRHEAPAVPASRYIGHGADLARQRLRILARQHPLSGYRAI